MTNLTKLIGLALMSDHKPSDTCGVLVVAMQPVMVSQNHGKILKQLDLHVIVHHLKLQIQILYKRTNLLQMMALFVLCAPKTLTILIA